MRFANTFIVEEKKNYKSLNIPQTQTLQHPKQIMQQKDPPL
jgi:hypothetical protein